MKKKQKQTTHPPPCIPLQAQEAPALPHAKEDGRPGTGSYQHHRPTQPPTSLILSQVNRKVGQKLEIPAKNHLTTHKQNLARLTWPELGSNPQQWWWAIYSAKD